jgi:hypothetical protein
MRYVPNVITTIIAVILIGMGLTGRALVPAATALFGPSLLFWIGAATIWQADLQRWKRWARDRNLEGP